jgi:PhzF family phenazine biosynthesis protein
VARAVPFVQADIFTTRAFAGNPAGAVLDADWLSEADMGRIGAEMRLAGTCFVMRATRPGAAYRLVYRSPTREIPYSGHTTLGGVHALLEAGRLGPGETVFDTAIGLLPVTIEPRDGATIMWLAPKVEPPRLLAAPLPPLLAALGLAAERLGDWARPAVTADTDVLLPLAGLAPLQALRPDMGALAAFAAAHGVRGVCVVARDTVDAGSASHCRFFAPGFGIPEDIVTGSVHSPLALWLAEAGVLRLDGGRAAFTAEQGDTVGRPGRLRVEIEGGGTPAPRVRVGGSAVTVLSGSLRLPGD